MTRARLIELLANIRKTLVSFLSIVMFVSLAVGLFLGIQGTSITLDNSSEANYGRSAFHDFEIISPYGLTEEALDDIAGLEEVKAVEPLYITYPSLDIDGMGVPIVVRSLTSEIDISDVSEGRLPSRAGEIAIGKSYAKANGIEVGDTISFVGDAEDEADADGMQQFTRSEFVVTGFGRNPNYISQLGGNLGMSPSGETLSTFAVITEDSFDPVAFMSCYPAAVVRCSSLEGLRTYSDEYQDRSEAIKNKLIELGEPHARSRFDALASEAQSKIDAAQEQIDAGEQMLEEANQQIAEGEQQLIVGQAQVDSALAQLESGQATYDQTRAQVESVIAEMRARVDSLRASFDEAMEELANRSSNLDKLIQQTRDLEAVVFQYTKDMRAEIKKVQELNSKLVEGEITAEEYESLMEIEVTTVNALNTSFTTTMKTRFPNIVESFPEFGNIPELNLGEVVVWSALMDEFLTRLESYVSGVREMVDPAQAEVEELRRRADDLKGQVERGQESLLDAEVRFRASLEASRRSLDEARQQAAAGQATIEEKTGELQEGKKLVEEKTVEVEKGKAQLEDARAQADKLVYVSWVINTRTFTGGAIALNNIVNLVRNLRLAMASLFVIVGLLVCYSVISRIVHEQTSQIGTKKALGFRSGEITSSYLAYTAAAVLLGVFLGLFVSLFVVQGILNTRLAANFDFEVFGPTNSLPDIGIITVLELVLLLGCTLFACRSVLKRNAVDLLAGEQTASAYTRFYERWSIWRKLPLFTQTVINNCVNDPRRVLATLIGVAGCTALIVTSVTLDGNIARSMEEQFISVYGFDETLKFDSAEDGARENIERTLEAKDCNYATVHQASFLLDVKGEPAFETLFVPEDDESFSKLFQLNAVPSTGAAPTSGAWVSVAHKEHRGLEVGDQVVICSTSGERYAITISGFFSFYIPVNTIVMSPQYYASVFGHEADFNSFLVKRSEGLDHDKLLTEVSDLPGFSFLSDNRAYVDGVVRLFKSVTTSVVGIYVALSAVIALIVLLNLDYMFIDEKKRELIVLMINGYSTGDAKAYIYRDAIVMTALGIIAGIALGIVIGGATVGAVEWQSCSFIKGPYLPACLLGAGLSAVFAAIMMLLALRRIPRFSLTDISRY